MAENREEILANFQGITAIEDVAEAIYHLEEANWDLLAAINRVMPQEAANSAQTNSHDINDVEMIDDDISVITPKTHPPDREVNNQASTSTSTSTSTPTARQYRYPTASALNLVTLRVICNGVDHILHFSDLSTVIDVRKRIEMVCGVPICSQQITGLGGSKATSDATLRSLKLLRNTVLHVYTADQIIPNNELTDLMMADYTLCIKYEDQVYTLKFMGAKAVREVKSDIYTLTDIPSRHQVWTGWPSVQALDDTVLGLLNLDRPVHELTVKRAPNTKPKDLKSIIVQDSDSENSSVDEEQPDAYIAEDEMFVDLIPPERVQPLMSERVEYEALGCIEFAERFRHRYGPSTPHFFEGTLQDAIKESCLKPAKERKLLGVYLHHEQSVLSNVFCAQLLGCDTVLQTLAANFVVYGWDLTHPANNNMLLASFTNALGPVASMTIRSIPVDRLPALVVIMRVRSNTEIYAVINGNVGVSELMAGLVEAWDRFSAQRTEDAKVERERDARQKVKREQDEAYQMSLEVDRAKEEEKKKIQRERHEEIERAESERQMEEVKKEALRSKAEARVPAEPAEDTKDVARIRMRLPPPNDINLERRFHPTDTLQALFDFLASKGYPQDIYKVISSWPRRDLTSESPSSTLKALNLYPQETVMVEER